MNKLTRRSRLAAVLATVGVAVSAVAVTSSTAHASPQAASLPFELTGEQPGEIEIFSTGPQVCDECYPDFLNLGTPTALGVLAEATLDLEYTAPGTTGVSYDDALLRQGANLPVTDTLVMMPGNVHATWHIVFDTGVFVKHPDTGEWIGVLDLSGIPNLEEIEQDFACMMPVEGTVDCSPSSVIQLPLAAVPLLPGISVTLTFNFDVTMSVSADGVAMVREVDVVGGPAGTNSQVLQFDGASPSILTDTVSFDCDEPAGNTATYRLDDASYELQPEMGLGMSLSSNLDYTVGSEKIDTFWQTTLASAPLDDVTLTGGGNETVLGELGADNLDPSLSGPVVYVADEGTPRQFGVNATDNCGTPAVAWQFSDGGVAFGQHPKHTFADDGEYTALVTATDDNGNVDTLLVDVLVGNEAPIASAGPDDGAVWGEPVHFGGAGTDPGAGDQASLTYEWQFGDGTPSASGGPNTVHTYATPGDYVATLKVCDKDGACGTDTRTTHVVQRAVEVAVVGPANAAFDTTTGLVASVVDELGQPVQNRTVTFFIDGQAVGLAATSSSGTATLQHAPQVPAGVHQLAASFNGDARYKPAQSPESPLDVVRKATSLTYTGAVTGAPNKTVALSATLVDATGTPLAGRTVAFQIGTQSASATTDANGKAATSLKLTQKNGTYTVSATWTPAGADVAKFLGSSSSATFKLQAK